MNEGNEVEYREMPTEEDDDADNVDHSQQDSPGKVVSRKKCGNKVTVKNAEGKINYEFCCQKCNQKYKYFYAPAAKDHNSCCPLEELLAKGIVVPSKESLLESGILISEYNRNTIETITID